MRSAGLLLLVTLLGAPVANGSDGQEPLPASASRPLGVAEVHAALEGLDGVQLGERIAQFSARAPRVAAQAMILRAGRSVPPGLTGARAERRAARHAEALAWVEERFGEDTAAEPEAVRRRVAEWRELFQNLLDPAAAEFDEGLVCATLSVSAELARYDLAWSVAQGLKSESTRVREMAQGALYSLYGRRYTDFTRFEKDWPQLTGRDSEGLFLPHMRAQQERIDELELELARHLPERALESLASGHPGLRTRVAELVQDAVGRKAIGAQEAIGALTERVEIETDPAAYHAALVALLELVQGMGPDAPLVQTLRERLTDPAVLGRLELADSTVTALARLPWPEDSGAGSNEGIVLCARLLGELAAPGRLLDYDRLHVALGAFQGICSRSELEPAQIRRLAGSARPVFELLLDETTPLEVRLDAADSAALLGGQNELPALLTAFEASRSPQLRLALLDSLEDIFARSDESEDPGSSSLPAEWLRRLGRNLTEALSSSELDLARRALELLASPLLAQLVAVPEPELTSAMLDTLAVEGLQLSVLQLMAGLDADPALAERLVALPLLDELVDANSGRPQALVQALAAAVGTDLPAALSAARRLAFDPRRSASGSSEEPERCLLALRLIDEFARAGGALPPETAPEVLAWALLVRRADGDRAGGPAALSTDALGRLGELARAVEEAEANEGEAAPARTAHLSALLAGDVLLRRGAPSPQADRMRVFETYRRILEREDLQPELARRVHRDRARFQRELGALLDAGAEEGALERAAAAATEDLVEVVFQAAPLGARDPDDLLTASELSWLRDRLDDDRRLQLGLLAVESSGWSDRGMDVRRADLTWLVTASEQTQDAGFLARVRELFAGLAVPEGEQDWRAELAVRLAAVPEPRPGDAPDGDEGAAPEDQDPADLPPPAVDPDGDGEVGEDGVSASSTDRDDGQ